jgi:hypothetical protein
LRPGRQRAAAWSSCFIHGAPRSRGGAFKEPPKPLQFAQAPRQANQEQAANDPHRAAHDEGVTGTKFVIGNAEPDCGQAEHKKDDANRKQKDEHGGIFS